MQRVASRELGPAAFPGTYLVDVPLVSEVVHFDVNAKRSFSIWVKHKVDAKRTRRLRITVTDGSYDVEDEEDYLGSCMVHGTMYHCWGFQLPE